MAHPFLPQAGRVSFGLRQVLIVHSAIVTYWVASGLDRAQRDCDLLGCVRS
jgi:hypothetical protein